jgi:hypothetical protein
LVDFAFWADAVACGEVGVGGWMDSWIDGWVD